MVRSQWRKHADRPQPDGGQYRPVFLGHSSGMYSEAMATSAEEMHICGDIGIHQGPIVDQRVLDVGVVVLGLDFRNVGGVKRGWGV